MDKQYLPTRESLIRDLKDYMDFLWDDIVDAEYKLDKLYETEAENV